MARKVFLSFLGAGAYEPITYYWEAHEPEFVSPERYIQRALLEKLKNKFNANDKAFIFLTPQAKKMHWEKDGLRDRQENLIPNKGLEKELSLSDLSFLTEGVDVVEKRPEAMSWEIFEKSLCRIKDRDELHVDITHAFRFMPMVLMALVNYLKAMRRIQVGGIYYGGYELKKDWIIKGQKVQCAPIINLSSISTIQDWATAAHLFNLSGNASFFPEKTEGDNLLTSHIRTLSNNIFAIRGPQIITGKDATLVLNEIATSQVPIPYEPIVKQILGDINGFRENQVFNMLFAVKWCIDKRLVPQGYALLSEFLPTYILWRSNEDFMLKLNRDAINGIAQIGGSKSTFRYDLNMEKRNQQSRIINKFLLFPELASVCKYITDLNQKLRNDILHAGFNKEPNTADSLILSLESSYHEISALIKCIEEAFESQPQLINSIFNYETPQKNRILINHSNHPLHTWNDKQLSKAEEWGNVKDFPFPNIPPDATSKQVYKLADKNVKLIRKEAEDNNITVHIMGELTYTAYIVQKLKLAGIPCIASTTERQVTIDDNGSKTSTFRFVAFREY